MDSNEKDFEHKRKSQSLKVPLSERPSKVGGGFIGLAGESSAATSATSSGGVKGGDAGTSGGIDSDKKMKTNLVKRRFMGLKMPDKQNEKGEEKTEEELELERLEVKNVRAKFYTGFILYSTMVVMLILQISIFLNFLQIKQDAIDVDEFVTSIRRDIGRTRLGIALEVEGFDDARVYCDENNGGLSFAYRRCYLPYSASPALTIPQMVEKCQERNMILFYPKTMEEIGVLYSSLDLPAGTERPTQFKKKGSTYVTYDDGGLSLAEVGDLSISGNSEKDALCVETELQFLRRMSLLFPCSSGTRRSQYICVVDF
ncbi:uncharacterized protein LOC134840275 [Symsagittifera roscoffensis]|uniref:uncharacterized protein LOC134840275 n=1 Tax=Symsagittifera roscoffensis TaxID=84072 RepID=UPI00307B49F3